MADKLKLDEDFQQWEPVNRYVEWLAKRVREDRLRFDGLFKEVMEQHTAAGKAKNFTPDKVAMALSLCVAMGAIKVRLARVQGFITEEGEPEFADLCAAQAADLMKIFSQFEDITPTDLRDAVYTVTKEAVFKKVKPEHREEVITRTLAGVFCVLTIAYSRAQKAALN